MCRSLVEFSGHLLFSRSQKFQFGELQPIIRHKTILHTGNIPSSEQDPTIAGDKLDIAVTV